MVLELSEVYISSNGLVILCFYLIWVASTNGFWYPIYSMGILWMGLSISSHFEYQVIPTYRRNIHIKTFTLSAFCVHSSCKFSFFIISCPLKGWIVCKALLHIFLSYMHDVHLRSFVKSLKYQGFPFPTTNAHSKGDHHLLLPSNWSWSQLYSLLKYLSVNFVQQCQKC